MTAFPPSTQLVPPPRRGRRLRRFLIFAALVTFIFFLPEIVAASGLAGWLITRQIGDLRGSVEVHKASLGWFWPVDLQDVVVRDEQGNTLAEIPQISSRKTLLALIWHPSDLGEWKIQQPTVHV